MTDSLSDALRAIEERAEERQRPDRWKTAYEAGSTRWRFYQDSWVEAEADIPRLVTALRMAVERLKNIGHEATSNDCWDGKAWEAMDKARQALDEIERILGGEK